MSEKIWSDEAWDDYLYWQKQDENRIYIAHCRGHYGDK